MTRSKKLLIIEDDKFISKALNIKLTKHGFETKTAMNAEKAIDLLGDWIPDLIILDLMLPGLNGYNFLRKIKSDLKYKKIPVIVASNLPEDPEKEPDEKSLYEEYIIKSDLDLETITKKVNNHLN